MIKQGSKITKGLFLLAILAFLLASLSHVAWLYRLYEPGTSIVNLAVIQLDFWGIISYGLAISIDVLIAWLILFYTVVGKRGSWLLWAFIVVLCVYSWYCNYLYTMAHNPQTVVNLWNIPLFFGFTTTGYLTPLVVSAYPVFIVVYTFLSSKLTIDEETAEELKKKADDLEVTQRERARIATLKREGLKNRIVGTLDTVSDITSHARVSLHRKPSESDYRGKEDSSNKEASEETEPETEILPIPLNTQNQESEQVEPLVNVPSTVEEHLPDTGALSAQNGHTPEGDNKQVLVGGKYLTFRQKK